jgi:DNA-binding MarR family transcriptional regulator
MSSGLTSLPTWILTSAAGRSHQILQARLARAGVNGYEYRCVAALAVEDHLSQTELGAAAVLDPRDISHTVRALEGRGLISRTKDPRHGRRQLVSLTAEGRRMAERLAGVIAEVQELVFRDLKTDERVALLKLLERVARSEPTAAR